MNLLKQFVAAVVNGVAELRKLHESIDKHTKAISEQREREREQSQRSKEYERPEALPLLRVEAECKTEPSEAREKNSRENRQFWVNVGLCVGTWLAFGAAAYYAAQARQQSTTMNHTYEEVQKQTTLLRQQVIGTQAAVIVINGSPAIGPLPTLGTTNWLSIGFKNEGHVVGTNLILKSTVTLLDSSGKKLRAWPCDASANTVLPEPPGGSGIYRQCLINQLSSVEIKRIGALTNIIAWDGYYTYVDGFDDHVREDLCYRHSPQVTTRVGVQGSGHLITCTDFAIEHEIVRRALTEKP